MLTAIVNAKSLYTRLTCSLLLGAFFASYATIPATETGFVPASHALADDDRDDDKENDRDDDRDDDKENDRDDDRTNDRDDDDHGGKSKGKKLDGGDDAQKKWTKKTKNKLTKVKPKQHKKKKMHRDRDDD